MGFPRRPTPLPCPPSLHGRYPLLRYYEDSDPDWPFPHQPWFPDLRHLNFQTFHLQPSAVLDQTRSTPSALAALFRSGFTPPGTIFPVSAAMLQDKEAYDVALENFSVPLLPLVEYKLDYQGRMTVQNETALRYRFIDMTAQTEALFVFVERVIETDLVQELDFVRNYDTAKSALQAIVDMPDRLIDLFIRLPEWMPSTSQATRLQQACSALWPRESKISRDCGEKAEGSPPSAVSLRRTGRQNEEIEGRGQNFLVLATWSQRIRCSSVNSRHRAETAPKVPRTAT